MDWSWRDGECALLRQAWPVALARSVPSSAVEAVTAAGIALNGLDGSTVKLLALALRLAVALSIAAVAGRWAPPPLPLLAGLAAALPPIGLALGYAPLMSPIGPFSDPNDSFFTWHGVVEWHSGVLADLLAVMLGAAVVGWVSGGGRPVRAALLIVPLAAVSLGQGLMVQALLAALLLALPSARGAVRRRGLAALALLSLPWLPDAAAGPSSTEPLGGAPFEAPVVGAIFPASVPSALTPFRTPTLYVPVAALMAALLLASARSGSAGGDAAGCLFPLYGLSLAALTALAAGEPSPAYAALVLGAAVGAGRCEGLRLRLLGAALLALLAAAGSLAAALTPPRVPPLPSCAGTPGAVLPWTWEPLEGAAAPGTDRARPAAHLEAPALKVVRMYYLPYDTRNVRTLWNARRTALLAPRGAPPSLEPCLGFVGDTRDYCLRGLAGALPPSVDPERACHERFGADAPLCLEGVGLWAVATAAGLEDGMGAAARACEVLGEGARRSCARGAGLAAGWVADGDAERAVGACAALDDRLGEGCSEAAAGVVGWLEATRGGRACDLLGGRLAAVCSAEAARLSSDMTTG